MLVNLTQPASKAAKQLTQVMRIASQEQRQIFRAALDGSGRAIPALNSLLKTPASLDKLTSTNLSRLA